METKEQQKRRAKLKYMSSPEKRLKEKERGKNFRLTHPNYTQEWLKKHPNYKNNWYKKNPEKYKEINKRKKFKKLGLTLEQYNKILNQQNNKCLICKRELIEKNIAKDHNHQTGKFRGIICRRCNSGIGFLNDNIKLLKSAIKYLERAERRYKK